jgi:hypothetical protein
MNVNMLSFQAHLKSRYGFLIWSVLIFTGILYCMLSIIHIFYPFNGDQALFNLFGESIDNNGIPYKDFWDIKQPGIFYFYYLGGKLLSFTEEGIHIFEALYWLFFSIVTIIYFRKSKLLNQNYLNILLPLFTVGSYYIMAGSPDLTQVEILVSLPLAFSIFIMEYYLKTNKIFPYFLLGVLLSIVLFYKLLFLLIIGLLAVIHFIEIIKTPGMKPGNLILKKILPALAGFTILPVFFILYSIHNGVLEKEIYTFFVLPPKLVNELPNLKGPGIFISSGLRFVKKFFPIIVLAIPGIFMHSANQRPLVIKLIIWLVAGALVIFLQKTSYWDYQYQLLIFPLGILSVIGIDSILTKYSRYKITLAGVFFIILMPFLFYTLKKSWFFYKYNPLHTENRLAYKDHYMKKYLSLKEDIKFADSIEQKDEIYIIGNPLYYYFSKRPQPVSYNGWSLEFYLDEQYNELTKQLNTALPEYILISTPDIKVIQVRAMILKTFLDNNYSLFKKSELGIWMERR